ncbi:hypothetical protein [Kitasatospora sp. NPDC091207]|uniref:hypothetical protein n=1 Tax=Kitasatospora sp. NPDC091207 TaxID=3364083 RepID=UPI00382BD002
MLDEPTEGLDPLVQEAFFELLADETVAGPGPVPAFSAAGRHRAPVIGATVALGAVGFALNFVALAWSPAAPLRYLSPFHYYTPADALAHGTVPWTSLAVLAAAGLAGTAVAFRLLGRRDLAP